MSINNQGVPQIQSPVVDEDQKATQAWFRFFVNLWNKAIRYPVSFAQAGKPPSGGLLGYAVLSAMSMAGNFNGSQGIAGTAPTAAATIKVNRVTAGVTTQVGTVVFALGVKTATFTTTNGAAQAFAPGDVLQLAFPNPQDATLADLSISFPGTLT